MFKLPANSITTAQFAATHRPDTRNRFGPTSEQATLSFTRSHLRAIRVTELLTSGTREQDMVWCILKLIMLFLTVCGCNCCRYWEFLYPARYQNVGWRLERPLEPHTVYRKRCVARFDSPIALMPAWRAKLRHSAYWHGRWFPVWGEHEWVCVQ